MAGHGSGERGWLVGVGGRPRGLSRTWPTGGDRWPRDVLPSGRDLGGDRVGAGACRSRGAGGRRSVGARSGLAFDGRGGRVLPVPTVASADSAAVAVGGRVERRAGIARAPRSGAARTVLGRGAAARAAVAGGCSETGVGWNGSEKRRGDAEMGRRGESDRRVPVSPCPRVSVSYERAEAACRVAACPRRRGRPKRGLGNRR